jgi:hypothetical protein
VEGAEEAEEAETGLQGLQAHGTRSAATGEGAQPQNRGKRFSDRRTGAFVTALCVCVCRRQAALAHVSGARAFHLTCAKKRQAYSAIVPDATAAQSGPSLCFAHALLLLYLVFATQATGRLSNAFEFRVTPRASLTEACARHCSRGSAPPIWPASPPSVWRRLVCDECAQARTLRGAVSSLGQFFLKCSVLPHKLHFAPVGRHRGVSVFLIPAGITSQCHSRVFTGA